jgi:hypothetical protein
LLAEQGNLNAEQGIQARPDGQRGVRSCLRVSPTRTTTDQKLEQRKRRCGQCPEPCLSSSAARAPALLPALEQVEKRELRSLESTLLKERRIEDRERTGRVPSLPVLTFDKTPEKPIDLTVEFEKPQQRFRRCILGRYHNDGEDNEAAQRIAQQVISCGQHGGVRGHHSLPSGASRAAFPAEQFPVNRPHQAGKAYSFPDKLDRWKAARP